MEILAAMERYKYDIRKAWLVLVEELVRNHYLEDANTVFLKGAKSGLQGTDELYDLLIEEDCKAGDHSNALTIAYQMEAAGRMATTFHFNCLLSVQGETWHRHDGEAEVGRASKLMMPELEEDGACDLLDKMMFREDEICMKGVVNDLHATAMDKKKSGKKKKAQRRSGEDSEEMVDLQTLLLRCAQAVSNDDRRSTSELLKQIKAASSPEGDAAQRLAHYFVEGLEARLAGTGSQLYQSLVARPTMVVDFLKAQHLFMSACCCKRVAYTFANKTIYDAAAGKSRLHIVDYGLNYGVQWPGLLRALAARKGGPPEVRITGIDLPQPGFHGDYNIHATGRRLANCARMLGVPFKFRGIGAKRETIKVEDLHIDRGEVLIVISLCHFRNLMDEEDLGFAGPNPRDQVLSNIREMRPDMFIHGILNGSYGATYFPTRFREALFHYSAQFDLLDATVPRESNERMLLERDIFGRHDGEAEVGRASKLMMPELEEDGACDLLDKMMFREDEICMKGVVNDLHATAMDKKKSGKKKKAQRRSGEDSEEMVDLQTLLLRCAQAVSNDDRRSTSELLKQIKAASSPEGDAAQRLAHYFVEGLEARLAGTGSQLYQSLVARPTMVVDFLKAQHLFMSACCCKRVAYTFANKTIYDVAAGKSRLHIVDYGLNYGVQWPGLLRALAARKGGPPEVRITGIDLPQPGFHGDYNIHATGRRLANCARMLGVPFKFRGIGAKRETIKVEDLHIDRGEVLIVISLCHFRNLMDEEDLGFAGPNPRDQVLSNIREMRPDMFIHGILNGSYGATYFPTRFREALFHYSAQFDLLDATVPRESNERMLLERDIFGRSILNVVACEGADRATTS
uniref:Uncharacterized protein n=1 Tax=Avena sativa TaxID=4498 RepID=A0ACD6ATU7_AVESA